MTKEEFINLDIQKKNRILLAYGKCFYESISYMKCIRKYYLLFDFIAEAEYSLDETKIITVTAFEPVTTNGDIIFQEPQGIYN